MKLFQMEHVTICYNGNPIVEDLNFELKQGEILGIVGESGSGKSTIIKAIMSILGNEGEITEGNIWYKGENLARMSEKELRRYLGPELGIIFQDCKASLCPVRKIGAQLCDAIRAHEKISVGEIRQRAFQIMKKIGLNEPERIWKSYPFQLSGGMNQRVGICMAVLQNPQLLLADEPTSALDVTVQKQVIEELISMKEEYKTSMIIVTHNIGVVRKMADKVMILKDGRICDYGKTDAILENPTDQYSKQLVNSVLKLNRKV